ncbi:hypothetical protein FRC07_008137 [Ceratobasidium sp. 392]|nr:hypothetical protein FRC07_008137 [Ceratobasidium sp. 392]
MAQTLSRFLGNPPLEHFAPSNHIHQQDLTWKTPNPTSEHIKTTSKLDLARARPPFPASAPKSSLPLAAPVTTPVDVATTSAPTVAATIPSATSPAPGAALSPQRVIAAPPAGPQPPPYVCLRIYNHFKASIDRNTFGYLWHIYCIHGKPGTRLHAAPGSKMYQILSKIDLHVLGTWIGQLGGHDELERTPHQWNRLAFKMKLVQSEDQGDEHAELVVQVIQRLARECVQPFERYCAEWPKVPVLEKERLLNQLCKQIQQTSPGVTQMPFDYGTWPPMSLDPISTISVPCVAVRVGERTDFGIPTDYATYFYMMKLWNLSLNQPFNVPPLPRSKPDANGNSLQLDCYKFNLEINKFEGAMNGVLNTPGAWHRLAFGMNLIEREDQSDAQSWQIITQLKIYVKDYLGHFGAFCDQWAILAADKKHKMLLSLLSRLTKGKAPESSAVNQLTPKPGINTNLGIQQPNYSSVDLYAYNTPRLPQNAMELAYFIRLWVLDAKIPLPLPTWNGSPIMVDFPRMRALIDGFGGSAVMRRFPELWRQMAYELKLVTREERESEHMKCVVESLKYIEQERLLPFEQFCTKWCSLSLEEKLKQITRLSQHLQANELNIQLPLSRPRGCEFQRIQVDVLSTARWIEQKMERFYLHEPFEDRMKRLSTLSTEEAGKFGMKDWIMQYQRAPFPDMVMKQLAGVLAGQPSSSKPLEILSIRRVGGSPSNVPGGLLAKPQQLDNVGLWPHEVTNAANHFVQMILKNINESRALNQSRIQLSELQRKRLDRIVRGAYPFALRFYCHAALHHMIYARGQWTEFLLRQPPSEGLGNAQLDHLVALDENLAPKLTSPHALRALDPTPTSTLKTTSHATPVLARVNVRGYNQPGAPKDHSLFNYLWYAHIAHGKLAETLQPSREMKEISPTGNVYALFTRIMHLGGFDELEHNPQIGKKVALSMGLIDSEDQDDQHSKHIVEIIRRMGREWLLPFEQYCINWPKLPTLERERLLYVLGKKLQEINPNLTQMPFDYGIWPPVSLDPVTPESAPCVAVRLCERSEPGIPVDYPICFYMMKLWDLSMDRPMVAPPLPQNLSGNTLELDCYTFNMEINKLPGGLNELLHSPGAWIRLAIGMNIVKRGAVQNNMRSIARLRAYVKDYLCHFGKFCDDWATLEMNKKNELVALLMQSLSPVVASMPGTKGKAPEITRRDSDSNIAELEAAALLPQPCQKPQSSVDLYAYDTPGLPWDNTTYNFFWGMWLRAAKPPILPSWKGIRLAIDFRRLRSLVDGMGGRPAIQRFPELWREMVYELKLATRNERDTEHIKYLVESLQFTEREWLVPFERFCNRWPMLGLEEKTRHIKDLVEYLKREKPGHPLPLLQPGNRETQTVVLDALSAARSMEKKMEGFYPNEPFEERVKRLAVLSVEDAEKYNMKDWVTRYQQMPFSDESVKTMAAVLAGQPTTSKPVQDPITMKQGGSGTKTVYCMPAESQHAVKPDLWPIEVTNAANEFIQDILEKINRSRRRATRQPRIDVPKSQRERLKRIVHEAYPFALRFYCHAALHYMIYAKGQWTEFLVRQYFFLHAGSSVYIINVRDARSTRGILRDEVQKTQMAYIQKSFELDWNSGRIE